MGTIISAALEKTGIDWVLFFATVPLLLAGLVTMDSFTAENYFFSRQVMWIAVALGWFFFLSRMDFRFLRRTGVLISLFLAGCVVLLAVFALAETVKGVKSWLDVGLFAIQPSDPMKIVIILILAKYFSRRHVEIAHIRHIIVSGLYAFIPFLLIFLQPDFGSAVIIFFIWFGMVLVSGISKKHLFAVLVGGIVTFSMLWLFVFEPYQQKRILTFLNPLADIRGAGYNANQSAIAVGSGQILGKGVGYGTQSRLEFLPEYETDFIFASFAEEWGFVGVLFLFAFFAIVIWRILANSLLGATNFEVLFGLGVAIMFISHFIVHVGMNIGLLPVTGTTIPFLSYGGSHLLTEFTALGILMGMRRYRLTAHKDDMRHEFLGVGTH